MSIIPVTSLYPHSIANINQPTIQDELTYLETIFNEGVLTPEACLKQPSEDLNCQFLIKITEAEEAIRNAKILLDGRDTSLPYSECIAVAEKAIRSAQNIKDALISRQEPLEEQNTDTLTQIEQQLKSMYALQPKGETTLQLKDKELLQKMVTVPSNEYYTTELGIAYYQPKVSHVNVRPFFQECCKEGGYKSLQTAINQTHFYGIEQTGVFYLVSLMKDQAQALYELERYSGSKADKKEVESRYKTNTHSTGFHFSNLLAWKSNPQKLNHNNQVKVSAEAEKINKQKAIMQEIEKNIIRLNEENQWGFAEFLILDTERQVNMGVNPRNAVMADCILLFYKKVEGEQHTQE